MNLPYTEPAILALPAIQAAARAGVSQGLLLAPAGLTAEQFAHPFMPIASHDLCALLHEIVQATGDPAFPIHALEHTAPGNFGLVGYAVATRPTVGMAVHQGLHGLRFFRSAYPVRIEELEPDVHETIGEAGPPWPHKHRFAEYGMGLCLDVIRKSSGRRLAPTEVRFAHADDEAREGLERYFGCPVRFGQGRTEMIYPAAWLGLACVRGDPDLAKILADAVDNELASLPPPGPRLADLARTAIADTLRDNHAHLATVSRRLGLRPRSLQHLLRKEGASFAALLDEERKQRALELLRGPEALDAVAYRLGYQGAATFIRAFRRWTGQTPAQYRRSRQETPSPR
jgi:AraC-like DNA-binding protein